MIEPLLRLVLAPDIGPTLAHKLLQRLGSPEAIFAAPRSELLAMGGMGEKRVAALLASTPREAEAEAKRAEKLGVDLISFDSDRYPSALKDLPYPPLVLYVKGTLIEQDRLALSVVGPRKPSDYARIMVTTLVPPISARGITIVSGLAYGIDAEAHRAALDCGGRTVAVLGQGLDTPIYPSANRRLARRILDLERGAILSVFPFSTEPEAGNFPHRNQIIAALSLGTLVIEAGEKSGALITATHANELGRTVMCCPGDANRASARGSNRLIADGAALIQKSDDILETMANDLRTARLTLAETEDATAPEPRTSPEEPGAPQPSDPAPTATATPLSDPVALRIRELLSGDHRPIDFIIEGCAQSGFAHGEVVQRLLTMELTGSLRQLPGGIFALVE